MSRIHLLLPLCFSLFATSASAIEPLRTLALDISAYNWNEATERLFITVVSGGATNRSFELEVTGKIRAEIFDPLSGQILSSTTVQDTSLADIGRVALPAQYINDSLRLEAVDGGGNTRLLDMLDTSSLSDFAELVAAETDVRAHPTITNSSMTTTLDSGDSANRIDILLLGDGYTQSEMSLWESDAEAALFGFLEEPPYNSYRSYFNAHRIDTVSNESGASHPENGIEKDTAFGSFYNCADIQQLLCVDSALVYGAVNALAGPGQADIIIIIVNDEEYGGAGYSEGVTGGFAVSSSHGDAVRIMLHEIGHSFGRLADEYDDPLPTTTSDCADTTETTPVNVNPLASFDEIKWKHWIDTVVTIPTPYISDTHIPGLYAGSNYCKELYRPTPSSAMRNLYRPFDAINEEALVLKIYESVNTIESSTPSYDVVYSSAESPVNFLVETLQPTFHNLQVNWYADDLWVASGTSLNSLILNSDSVSLRVEVTDPSDKVRKDSNQNLLSSRTWLINNSITLNSPPVFSDNTLYLPFVRIAVDQSLLQVELQVASFNPPTLYVSSEAKLNDLLQPSQPAIFTRESLLVIERLNVNGVDHKIVLRYQPEMPGVTFTLESATRL